MLSADVLKLMKLWCSHNLLYELVSSECVTHGGLITLKAFLFVKVTTTLQGMRELHPIHFVLKRSKKA